MGTSGNRDCQWASRSALKDFTEDALTISAGRLFQSGTVRMVKANWRLRDQHHVGISAGRRYFTGCNLVNWPRVKHKGPNAVPDE